MGTCLILLSSGALLLIKEGTPAVTAELEGDDIDFALDFLLCFIAESHRRQAYVAWKQENGFVDQQRGQDYEGFYRHPNGKTAL